MRCSGHNGFTNYRKRRRQKTDHHDHNIYSLLGEAADYFTHSGSIFPGSVWVAPSVYFIGIAAIICSGIILKKTKALSGNPPLSLWSFLPTMYRELRTWRLIFGTKPNPSSKSGNNYIPCQHTCMVPVQL